MSMIRSRWAAVGAAVAITLGAGGVSLTQAAISSGEKPVYVSLGAPCRVIDTRSGAPISAGDAAALTVQITGANGACVGDLAIPADAVGVSTNVTVIQPNGAPSGRSYFTVYPADATRPVTSNLNFVNGQAPTPNKVDVGLSAGGQITLFNFEGSAHASVDIFGYYIDHDHDDRYYTEGEVDTALEGKADAADVYTKAEVDALVAPFTNSVIASASSNTGTTLTTEAVMQTVTLMPPADGVVIVDSQAHLGSATSVDVRCSITTGSIVDFAFLQLVTVNNYETINGTRAFDVTAGNPLTVNLVCETISGSASFGRPVLTAIFAPS